eukprot:760485-Hanusia_phi.AAC.1
MTGRLVRNRHRGCCGGAGVCDQGQEERVKWVFECEGVRMRVMCWWKIIVKRQKSEGIRAGA